MAMDPSLLKTRESFLKQASKNVSSAPKPKPKKETKVKKKPENEMLMKQMKQSASTAARHKNKFRMIKIFVDYLKSRYLASDYDHRALEDMQQTLTPTNMDQDITDWLRQALIENPKVDYDTMSRKFLFKPSLPIKKRSDLGKLLRRYDEQGLGGVLLSDIAEALPNPEKVLKKLGDSVLVITRQDKEKVVFYKNPNLDVEVDEDIKALWRAVSVEGMGEADISKYLQNVGLTVMEGTAIRKRKVPGQQSKAKRKSRVQKVQNVHLDVGVLKDYSDKGEGTGKNIQQ